MRAVADLAGEMELSVLTARQPGPGNADAVLGLLARSDRIHGRRRPGDVREGLRGRLDRGDIVCWLMFDDNAGGREAGGAPAGPAARTGSV